LLDHAAILSRRGQPGTLGSVKEVITRSDVQTIANLQAVLEAGGSSLDRLVKTTVEIEGIALAD
jgi:enamine deaminase RidA (YjgF/YER057c/UK114 family)